MRYLSVCSGIEAATVAWHPLGWEPLAFSEIEPFPRAVLAHHYPGTPCYGDFTLLRDEPWIGQADLLVGGTPCQGFSVAGLRGSLDDDRSNLCLEFVRLANAIDVRRQELALDPAWVLWENVPGVLSVKDNAFGAFLGGLVGSDAPPSSLLPSGESPRGGPPRVWLLDPKGLPRGGSWMPSISDWRNDGGGSSCSLLEVLEAGDVPTRYFLSSTACRGILRRAEKRGRGLPPALREALRAVAEAGTPEGGKKTT
jgi:hypothetical protein